jgi:polyhydroxyalkanoate synthesis regulator phasin
VPDVASLTQLIPLGGVTFLIIYLVGTLVSDRATTKQDRMIERTRWTEEREEMRRQHRKDIENITSDMISQLKWQRERITQLEAEVRELRNRREQL